MKSNYMRSAEIKIAQNPDMDEWDKQILIWEAQNKETGLKIKLGLLHRVYTTTDSYARHNGFNASRYFIDEFAYEPQVTTALTRENLERVIENIRAIPAQEYRFIGTRNSIDAISEYYRAWQAEPINAVAQIKWGE